MEQRKNMMSNFYYYYFTLLVVEQFLEEIDFVCCCGHEVTHCQLKSVVDTVGRKKVADLVLDAHPEFAEF